MEPTTDLLLVRHGQSVWNAEGRWQGQADPPLSPLGVRQAAEASARLGTFDAVVASDLQRARHTADLLARDLGIGPVEVDELWRERSAGEWSGLTRVEIEERWPGALARGERPPGFEPHDSIVQRAVMAVALIHRRLPGAQVLVVTHGGVIRAIEQHLGEDAGLLANLGGRWVHVTDQRMRLGERVDLVDRADMTVPQQL